MCNPTTPSAANNAAVARLAELLDAASPDAEFSRTELYKIILDRTSIKIDDAVMEAIFEECDADGSGLVAVQELHDFCRQQRQESAESWSNKARSVLREVSRSLTFWAFLFFASSEFTSFFFTLRWKLKDTEEAPWNYASFYNYLLIIGGYGFVGLVYDEFAKDLKLVERAKAKIVQFVNKQHGDERDNGTITAIDDGDLAMNPQGFSKMLDKGGLYLPSETLMYLFKDIDKDESGEISFNEVKEYAAAQEERGILPFLEFHGQVLKECFRSLDYWLEWGWTTAATMNLITSYNETWSEDAIWHIDGAAYCLYLFCALWQHRMNFKYAAKTVKQAEDMKRNVETLVVDIGSQALASHTGKSSKDLQEEIRSSLKLKTKEAQETCRVVFERLGSNYGGLQHANQDLDFVQVYDALTQAGFVVELDILRSIFDEADTDGDGHLQMDEFINYILNLQPKTGFQKNWDTLKVMVAKTADFMCANFEMTGAVLLVVGNYATVGSLRTEQNIWLSSDCFWFVSAAYQAFAVILQESANFDALVYSKSMFKNAIIRSLGFDKDNKKLDENDRSHTNDMSESEV